MANKRDVNVYKYVLVVMFISFFWAFVGGLIIAQNRDKLVSLAALITLLGILSTIFLFDFIIKKKKWKWIFKSKNEQS